MSIKIYKGGSWVTVSQNANTPIGKADTLSIGSTDISHPDADKSYYLSFVDVDNPHSARDYEHFYTGAGVTFSPITNALSVDGVFHLNGTSSDGDGDIYSKGGSDGIFAIFNTSAGHLSLNIRDHENNNLGIASFSGSQGENSQCNISYFRSNVSPAETDKHNLGDSSSLRWNNVYANQFYGDGSNLTCVGGATAWQPDQYKNLKAGDDAGAAVDAGTCYNIFIGHEAGKSTKASNDGVTGKGDDNVFMGKYAGHQNTTGSYNIFTGTSSGYCNETGDHNIALGFETGKCLTGSCNIFLGFCAGRCSTTGEHNIFMGHKAGFINGTHNNNIFLGYYSGINVTAPTNVAIGNQALLGGGTESDPLTGQGNVAIGPQAAKLLIGISNHNTFIGNFAGQNQTAGSCNVVIGYNANNACLAEGCQLTIGINANNWLSGDKNYNIKPGKGIIDCTGSCGTADQVLTSHKVDGVDDNPDNYYVKWATAVSQSAKADKVGIGTTTNEGGDDVQDYYLPFVRENHPHDSRDYEQLYSGKLVYRYKASDDSSRVGINTDIVGQELNVYSKEFSAVRVKSARTESETMGTMTQIGGLQFADNINTTGFDNGRTMSAIVGTVGGDLILKTGHDATDNGSNDRVIITPIGHVGIGTTNPITDEGEGKTIKEALETNTRVLAVGIVTAKEYYGTFKGTIDGSATIVTDKIQASDGTYAQVIDNNTDGHFKVLTEGTERLRIDKDGRFLLRSGTTESQQKTGGFGNALQVEGTDASTASISITRNSDDKHPAYLNFGKSRGTDVGSDGSIKGGDIIGQIDFTGSDGSGDYNHFAAIHALVDGLSDDVPVPNDHAPGRLIFKTCPSGSTNPLERLRIDKDGNIYGGGTVITEDDLSWTPDTYQRLLIFSGQTGGDGTKADGTIVVASPETHPSNTRIGSFVFGCKTEEPESNQNLLPHTGAKASIEGHTNINVADAWKTGASIIFKTYHDNDNDIKERLRIGSKGQIGLSKDVSGTWTNDFGDNNQVLTSKGDNGAAVWQSLENISFQPAGSDKQLQWNDNNSLAGTANLEWGNDSGTITITKTGSLVRSANDDSSNFAEIHADGGIEIKRSTGLGGGPYLDFRYTTGDADARIAMDRGAGADEAAHQADDNFSAIRFDTGGGGFYNWSDNTSGRITEKLRIGRYGEIGILAGAQIPSTASGPYNNDNPFLPDGSVNPSSNNPIVQNNRSDAEKYGDVGYVLKSAGKGASVYWGTNTADGEADTVKSESVSDDTDYILTFIDWDNNAPKNDTSPAYRGLKFDADRNLKYNPSTDLLTAPNLTVTGNTTLGDANSDTTIFNSKVKSHILPEGTDSENQVSDYTLGEAGAQWKEVHAEKFIGSISGSVSKIKTIANANKTDAFITFVEANHSSSSDSLLFTNALLKYTSDNGNEKLTIDGSADLGSDTADTISIKGSLTSALDSNGKGSIVPLTDSGVVLAVSLRSSGSGYTSGTATFTTTSSGTGTELTLDLTISDSGDGSGGVNSIQPITVNAAGENYAIGDIVTLDGGNGDATLIITDIKGLDFGSSTKYWRKIYAREYAGKFTGTLTSRNIAMTGDVAWNVNFDGSDNVTADGTIQTNAVEESMLNINNNPSDGYFLKYVDSTTGMKWVSNPGSGADANTLKINETNDETQTGNFYPTFVEASGNSKSVYMDSELKYNAKNDTLTVKKFIPSGDFPTTAGKVPVTTVTGSGESTVYGWAWASVPSGGSSDKATNLAGGLKGDLPYQSAANTTAFLNISTTEGDVLKANTTTGLPEWGAAPAGSIIQQGDTSAEVVDSGTNGHFKVTTENTERLRIESDGQWNLGNSGSDAVKYGESGYVLKSQGKNAPPVWGSIGNFTAGTTKIATIKDVKTRSSTNPSPEAENGGDAVVGANLRKFNTLDDTHNIGITLDNLLNGYATIIKVPAGTYSIRWSAPAWDVNLHNTVLQYSTSNSVNSPEGRLNVNVTSVQGSSEFAARDDTAGGVYLDNSQTSSTGVIASVTFTQNTYIQLSHWCQTAQEWYGLGSANYSASAGSSVYAQIEIEDLSTAVKEGTIGKVDLDKTSENTSNSVWNLIFADSRDGGSETLYVDDTSSPPIHYKDNSHSTNPNTLQTTNLSVTGTTWLGSADGIPAQPGGDTVTWYARSSTILPQGDLTNNVATGTNLGSGNCKWDNIYVNKIDAGTVMGALEVGTEDTQVLYTKDDGTNKVAAGTDNFTFVETTPENGNNRSILKITNSNSNGSGGELTVASKSDANFVTVHCDGGIEICRTIKDTGTPGGAYIDWKDEVEDYEARIQLTTDQAEAGWDSDDTGGLLFETGGIGKRHMLLTKGGILGVTISNDGAGAIVNKSQREDNFAPGYSRETSSFVDGKVALDVDGMIMVRRTGAESGVEGGQIVLNNHLDHIAYSIDVYGSSESNSRLRIIDEKSTTQPDGQGNDTRGTQRFAMNRSGAITFNDVTTTDGSDNQDTDYGTTDQVLTSRGHGAHPVWKSLSANTGGGLTLLHAAGYENRTITGHTLQTNTKLVRVRLIGAGGGSGGIWNAKGHEWNNNDQNSYAATYSGGGGSFIEMWFDAADLPSCAFIVGDGGTAGPGGEYNADTGSGFGGGTGGKTIFWSNHAGYAAWVAAGEPINTDYGVILHAHGGGGSSSYAQVVGKGAGGVPEVDNTTGKSKYDKAGSICYPGHNGSQSPGVYWTLAGTFNTNSGQNASRAGDGSGYWGQGAAGKINRNAPEAHEAQSPGVVTPGITGNGGKIWIAEFG